MSLKAPTKWDQICSEVKLAGLSKESSEKLVTLYNMAFQEFGTQALWNMRPVADPAAGDALAITRALRTHAGMNGRRLAEQIEELCSAAH